MSTSTAVRQGHARPALLPIALPALAFLVGGGQVLAQCGPDPNDPLPLEVWNSLCYDTCAQPTCDPDDPDCCDPNCMACLAGRGCLPLAAGISWFDANGDGWTDAFTGYHDPVSDPSLLASLRRRLFWNSGSANPTWTEGCLVSDITTLPNAQRGCTVGDINNDGYPEYVNDSGTAVLLYHRGQALTCDMTNGCGQGGSQCSGCDYANFVNKAACLGVNTVAAGETCALADVDGDGDVDVFICSETKIRLFRNLGVDPNDPNCDDPNCSPDPNVCDMDDYTGSACYDPNHSGDCLDPNADTTFGLPEGTLFCDYDRDGDLDLFCGNRLWQNVSVNAGQPRFRGLRRQACGLVPTSGDREEGGAFIDVDMDGDLDVIRVSFGGEGIANEHLGDGALGENTELPFVDAAIWGISGADWDNDGDIDVTIGKTFRRNRLLEEAASGTPCGFGGDCFELVTFVDDPNLTNAIPAWADVDRDGDLDCAQPVFVANPTVRQRLFRNHLYTGDCNEPVKRYVNVRPVRSAPTNGLNNRDYTENEFGATVELVVKNDPNENTRDLRRVQFTASSSGYLNQNEYPLHFAPPADPDPNDPNEDIRFDLYVDFPSLAGENWRVDWTVNSQLANINLAQLYVDPNDEETWGRPITVYRDGRVRFKGADPNAGAVDDPNGARMYLLGGPLRLPPNDPNDPNSALPGLTSGSKIVGCRFTKGAPPDPNTDPAASEVRVREFIIDGQLDEPDPNGCPYNIVVLDVTDPNNPVTIGGLNAKTFPNNRRTFIPVPPDPNDPNNADWFVLPLDPNNTRTYDVRARVTSYRTNNLSDLTALSSPLGITVTGGLQIINSAGKDICTEKMNLTFGGGNTSPVKVRLSRKSN